MRRAIKRFLLAAYCWHIVPAWLVSASFRALRLEAL